MSEALHNHASERDETSCPFEAQGEAAAFALDMLHGEEPKRFTEHLATCTSCPDAVIEFRATAGQLPLAVDAQAPSPELRSRILAAVAEEARAERQQRAPVAPTPLPLRRRTPQLYALAAVLLLALGLGQLAWNLTLQRNLQQTRAELSQVQGDLPSTRWQLVSALPGQTITGDLVYLRDRQQAVLVGNGLPALTTNQVYEVWLLNEGSPPVPQTVFLTPTTAIQADLDRYQKIAITIEPGPHGSAAPTSPVLAVGSPVR